MNKKSWIRIGAISGFLAVALGAFGAHGLKDTLTQHGRLATWETAVLYHLVHSLAALLPWSLSGPKWNAAPFFLVGILIFSGSLYVLSLTGMTWLGAVTPLGGVSFLVGWVMMMVRAGDEA